MAEAPAPVTGLRFQAGLNNKARETALPEGALRVCTNLDVTNQGTLKTRAGLRALATGDWHSLYSHPHGYYLCAVHDGWLGVWRGAGFEPLVEAVEAPVRFTDLNGDVFWSDGQKTGRIDAAGVAQPWGLQPPAFTSVQAETTGGLDAGSYQIALTALYQGQESGALSPEPVAVMAGGGIQVTVPTAPQPVQFSVYLTPPNGDSSALFQVETLAGGASALIGSRQPPGKRLESLRAVKPLPADHLVTYKGRIWAASGTTVWFTDTLSPYWLFPEEGYYQFDAPVTLLEAAEDGLYIAAGERTYYLQGTNPMEMTQRPVMYAGAVAGCSTGAFPYYVLIQEDGMARTRSCAWLSTDGVFCIGRPGGMISRVTDKGMALDVGSQGSLGFWQADGMRRFLMAVMQEESGREPNTARDRQVHEVFLNGVNLVA